MIQLEQQAAVARLSYSLYARTDQAQFLEHEVYLTPI